MTMLVTRLACLKEPLTYLVVSTNSMVTTVGAGLPFPWHYKHTYGTWLPYLLCAYIALPLALPEP